MSMYNMLFGHPSSDLTKYLVDEVLQLASTGRFRDIHLVKEDDEIVIRILTRDGGNNRECSQYDEEFGNSSACECTGCNQTYYFPSHPEYIRDEDCEFDSTYAYTYFRIPENHKPKIQNMLKKKSTDE